MSPALREGFPRAGSGVCAKRTPRGLKRSETGGLPRKGGRVSQATGASALAGFPRLKHLASPAIH